MSSWTSLFLSASNADSILAIFVNPNFEVPLDGGPDRRLSITVDTNFGYLRTKYASGETLSAPFFAPTIGVRWYVPTGFGGAIISQQFGTGFISVALPGSVAYDIPLELGAATLHLFPEVRWDPTFIFAGETKLSYAFFSGGLTFMLEL